MTYTLDKDGSALPPYKGPNDTPLPDHPLTDKEIKEALLKLFPDEKEG